MALNHRKLPSVVYAIGMVVIYLGERVLEPGRTAVTATVLGLVAGLAALLLGLRASQRRASGLTLPGLYALGLLALLLYFVRSPLPGLGHRALAVSSPRLDVVLAALWPALMFASLLPTLLVELALGSMARSPAIDRRRVRAALLSGLGTACALVFCFALAFMAAELGWKADLSFFRTSRASATTRQLVGALDNPVEATLVYPPGNEVAEELTAYFAELARASARFTVSRLDQAVDPARAKTLGVSSNGVVVLSRGEVREQLQIPLKLDGGARARLRALDQDVYKRLVALSRGKRTLYLVQGHEERLPAPRQTGANPQASISKLKELLTLQNLDVRELGMAQGLGNEVPADAGLVMVIGPQRPMLAEETAALVRYFGRGGRLLVAVDPEAADAAAPLLAALSLELSSAPLANDRLYWARTHQKADRTGIAAGSYSSHAAVTTLAQFGTQLPVVFLGAGVLGQTKVAPAPAPKVDLIVRSDGGSWIDKNGNLDFDAGAEERKAYPIAAAVTLPKPAGDKPGSEARAFVVGDSDAFSDLVIVNRANAVFAIDVLRWLLGEPEVAGPPTTEEDVPVRHTRKQDTVWFYASVFATPGAVLLLGWLVSRKRRSREVKP